METNKNDSNMKLVYVIMLIVLMLTFIKTWNDGALNNKEVEEETYIIHEEELIPATSYLPDELSKAVNETTEAFKIDYREVKSTMEVLADFKQLDGFLNVKTFDYAIMPSTNYSDMFTYIFDVSYYNSYDEIEESRGQAKELMVQLYIAQDKPLTDNLNILNDFYRTNYKYSNLTNYDSSVKSLTELKQGNCNAFTFLTKLILEEAGYRTGIISTTLDGIPHVLNIIEVDDTQYYFDGTVNIFGEFKDLKLEGNYEIIYSI